MSPHYFHNTTLDCNPSRGPDSHIQPQQPFSTALLDKCKLGEQDLNGTCIIWQLNYPQPLGSNFGGQESCSKSCMHGAYHPFLLPKYQLLILMTKEVHIAFLSMIETFLMLPSKKFQHYQLPNSDS
jgi:hypothetical protein